MRCSFIQAKALNAEVFETRGYTGGTLAGTGGYRGPVQGVDRTGQESCFELIQAVLGGIQTEQRASFAQAGRAIRVQAS
jgi:hypothetical protein